MLRTEAEEVANLVHFELNVVVVNGSRTGSGRKETGEHGHGCRFSGTVVAEKRGYLAFVKIQAQVVDGNLSITENKIVQSTSKTYLRKYNFDTKLMNDISCIINKARRINSREA